MDLSEAQPHPASFRDPSGYIFRSGGRLYRRVNSSYKEHYDRFLASGLYEALIKESLIVPFEEVQAPAVPGAYKTLSPEMLPYISHPYEWCFSQLKDAALATLKIQKLALERGMVLKDASAYNIQFRAGKPVLIDTLSFEIYGEGEPWIAYRQFCQHFLAPLSLMARRDVRLSRLLSVYIDGIPLDLASELLPSRTWLSFSLLTHIHLHARSQTRYSDAGSAAPKPRVPLLALRGIVESLESAIGGLEWRMPQSEWGDYYENARYTEHARGSKAGTIARFLERAKPSVVWDLGGNRGDFSRLASERGIFAVCFDIDPVAVEKNYLECRARGEARLLPLVLDLTNPSADLGWAGEERASLASRGPADLVMALALMHHLAISNNVPFSRLARYFSSLGRSLIIEYIPKDDSQVARLLQSRKDIFDAYGVDDFERAFSEFFAIEAREPVEDSSRVLYLMRRIAG